MEISRKSRLLSDVLTAVPDDPEGKRRLNPLAHRVETLVELTSLSRSSLYKAISTGELKARKLGRSTVVLDSDLREWLFNLPMFDPIVSESSDLPVRDTIEHTQPIKSAFNKIGKKPRGKSSTIPF